MGWFKKLFGKKEPWEAARPNCLDYANCACRAAQDEGYRAGVLEATLKGTGYRHAVTWIIVDGEELLWDNAWHTYRKLADFSVIHRRIEGQSKGSYDYLPHRVSRH